LPFFWCTTEFECLLDFALRLVHTCMTSLFLRPFVYTTPQPDKKNHSRMVLNVVFRAWVASNVLLRLSLVCNGSAPTHTHTQQDG
jgi:hypothetical protein